MDSNLVDHEQMTLSNLAFPVSKWLKSDTPKKAKSSASQMIEMLILFVFCFVFQGLCFCSTDSTPPLKPNLRPHKAVVQRMRLSFYYHFRVLLL